MSPSKVAAVLFSVFATAGCAVNSIREDGMQVQGHQVPVFGDVESKVHPPTAVMLVMNEGLRNSTSGVSEYAKYLMCTTPGLNSIAQLRDKWRRNTGERQVCPPTEDTSTGASILSRQGPASVLKQ